MSLSPPARSAVHQASTKSACTTPCPPSGLAIRRSSCCDPTSSSPRTQPCSVCSSAAATHDARDFGNFDFRGQCAFANHPGHCGGKSRRWHWRQWHVAAEPHTSTQRSNPFEKGAVLDAQRLDEHQVHKRQHRRRQRQIIPHEVRHRHLFIRHHARVHELHAHRDFHLFAGASQSQGNLGVHQSTRLQHPIHPLAEHNGGSFLQCAHLCNLQRPNSFAIHDRKKITALKCAKRLEQDEQHPPSHRTQ